MIWQKDLTVITPALESSNAQFIYDLMATGLSNESIFQKNNLGTQTWIIYWEWILDVRNEKDGLEEIAYASMMRVDAPTSIEELESELASDILNISILVKDFMDYVLHYQANTTRVEFEEQFIFLKTQNEEMI